MTHAACRRRRGARFLLALATILRHKEMKRSDRRPHKIPHPDVQEFDTLCRRLAGQIEREARNFRRRK
jgi:hypothetical protein